MSEASRRVPNGSHQGRSGLSMLVSGVDAPIPTAATPTYLVWSCAFDALTIFGAARPPHPQPNRVRKLPQPSGILYLEAMRHTISFFAAISIVHFYKFLHVPFVPWWLFYLFLFPLFRFMSQELGSNAGTTETYMALRKLMQLFAFSGSCPPA